MDATSRCWRVLVQEGEEALEEVVFGVGRAEEIAAMVVACIEMHLFSCAPRCLEPLQRGDAARTIILAADKELRRGDRPHLGVAHREAVPRDGG